MILNLISWEMAIEAAADDAPSIYGLYSPVRRNLTILAASIGFLLAFANSIYLPALEVSLPAVVLWGCGKSCSCVNVAASSAVR